MLKGTSHLNSQGFQKIFWVLAAHIMAHKPAAAAAHEILLEMQNFSLHLRPRIRIFSLTKTPGNLCVQSCFKSTILAFCLFQVEAIDIVGHLNSFP